MEFVPKHVVQSFMVEAVSVIHEAEAHLSFNHSFINPELLGTNIWVIGIVCQETETSESKNFI